MAITTKTDLGVTWTRADWRIGDAITEQRLDSIENGIYILMNNTFGNNLSEKVSALEKEIGGTYTNVGYTGSRLDSAIAEASAGKSAINLIGAGDILDYDVPVIEQLKNQQDTLEKILALLSKEGYEIKTSWFLRCPLCFGDDSNAAVFTDTSTGARKYFRITTKAGYDKLAESQWSTLPTGVTQDSDGAYVATISRWKEIFEQYLNARSTSEKKYAVKIAFNMKWTDPNAALRLTYKYSGNQTLEDYNYYQWQTKNGWMYVSFISGFLDGQPLPVTGIEELKYGNVGTLAIKEIYVMPQGLHNSGGTGTETYLIEMPQYYNTGTLNLNTKQAILTLNGVTTTYDFDWAPSVLKQGFKLFPVKKIVNNIGS